MEENAEKRPKRPRINMNRVEASEYDSSAQRSEAQSTDYNNEGGYTRQPYNNRGYNNQGGYNRGGYNNRENGGYNRYGNQGGYNRDNQGGYNRYGNQGGYNRDNQSGYNRYSNNSEPVSTEAGEAIAAEGVEKPTTPQEGGYNRQEGGYGYNRQGGYNNNRQGGYNNNRQGGYNNNRQGGYNNNRQGGYGNNRQGGYGNNRQGGYGNNRQQGGYNNRQGGYGNNRQQGGYGNNRQQGGYGNNRQQGGYGNNRQQGGFNNKRQQPKQQPIRFTPRPQKIEYEMPPIDPNEQIRLNKFLANAGICSRREADELIQAGKVLVNGTPATELGVKIGVQDIVEYEGKVVTTESKCYVLLNKPKDTVTTVDDPNGRKTVMDLVKDACTDARIYPVGRLDRNTTGVLLLTNDGDLASKLTHPKYIKKKIYQVWTDKPISEEDMQRIADGIELEDGPVHADAISYVAPNDRKQAGIEIHSGRNRIVRRIFETLGYHVVKLDRVYFAGLTKKDLPRGRWRYLTQQEVNLLKQNSFE